MKKKCDAKCKVKAAAKHIKGDVNNPMAKARGFHLVSSVKMFAKEKKEDKALLKKLKK